ncbi:MAG: malectin domain-containing carbohydrate-binding protein, partial [Capsulimonadaceae bacterium]
MLLRRAIQLWLIVMTIMVLSSQTVRAQVIAINSGGTATGTWVADTDFNGGTTTSTAATITTTGVTNPAPQAVYQTNRYGAMTYTIGGLTASTSYSVRLHFAETYWTAKGDREFNVSINSAQVLTDFDIFATAGGGNIANIQSFSETTNSSGQFVVAFANVIDNAQINGIEIDSVTAPAAPTGLTATAGNAQILLSWTASVGATSYSIYRGTASGGESGTAVANGVSATSYTNTGLTNGTTYYYKITAVNAAGTSAQSTEASATPSASAGAMVLGVNCGGSATGSWVTDEDYNGGTADVVTNTINTASVTNPAPIAVYQSNRYGNMTYTIGGLTASTAYTVRLHFCETFWDAAGDREFNLSINGTQVLTNFDMFATAGGENIANIQQFTETTNSSGQFVMVFTLVVDQAQVNGIEIDSITGGSAPSAPTGLTASAGNAQVALSWTASTGATSYNVYRGTASGGESATAIATGVTATGYTNTGLTNGTAYYYKVAALNAGGTSAQSSEASATPQVSAPAAPTGLTATAGNAQVALSWTASTGATSYNIYRGTASGGESATAIATGVTATSYTNTGLTNGTAYYFKVAALNAGGTSAQSSEASATPQVTAPAAPTGLTATAGNAQVALSWTASTGATS